MIVSKCADLTKILGKLVQRADSDLSVLTLSRSDEKNPPYPSQNKKTQVREDVKETFYGEMNFK